MDSQREILFVEKCKSSAQEIYYAKPADQSNVVMVKNKKTSGIVEFVKGVLLPRGYPESVSEDYMAYQKWDTAQTFCSTIMSILATQAVLKGVGVGDTAATPLSATITWVLKDGCGHLGRILFAYSHGGYLDAYSKRWRLIADLLNDIAMCIEISLPLFTDYTTYILCISTVLKSIVGVAGGATRVAMTQHHAIRGNIGDVSAKDSAQETAVNLVASIVALLMITLFGSSLVIFVVMMILHLLFNYFAVKAVCLKSLNEPRFLQVIEKYLNHEGVATPSEINNSEPVIFPQMGTNSLDIKTCGFQIKMGKSLTHMVKYSSEASYLKTLQEIYSELDYIIFPNMKERIMYVFFKDLAMVNDILQAYFHAVLLAFLTHAIAGDSMVQTKPRQERIQFSKVRKTLQGNLTLGYERSLKALFEPPFELATHMRDKATEEWPKFRTSLWWAEWSLTNHLLIVDDWRVTSDLNVDTTYTRNWSPERVRRCHSTPTNLNLKDDVFMEESISPVDPIPLVSTPSMSDFENDVSIELPSLRMRAHSYHGWPTTQIARSVTENSRITSTSSSDGVNVNPALPQC